jgi:flavin reductase (DIM6/NTAB) family NADH-FMN oxidoreductase RutF
VHAPAGDHLLVLGRMLSLDVAAKGRRLVFYRGGYSSRSS